MAQLQPWLSASELLFIQCTSLCGGQGQVTSSGKPRAKGHLPVTAAGTYLEGDIVCSQCHVLRKMLQALSHSVGSWTSFTPTVQPEG